MLALASHERIETGSGRLRDHGATGAGHDADALEALRTEREQTGRGARRFGGRRTEDIPGAAPNFLVSHQLKSSRLPLYSPQTPIGAPWYEPNSPRTLMPSRPAST